MGISEWADMMPHTITVEPFVSEDMYGKYTYGAPATHQARCQGKNRMVRTATGEEVASTVTVYVGLIGMNVKDRITLPATFHPTQPPILALGQVSDESGSHHTVVYA